MNQLYEYGNIMIGGCGGGYDIYTSIPIYLDLLKRGHNITMTNVTFTNIDVLQTYPQVMKGLWVVTAESAKMIKGFHPELSLSIALLKRGISQSIYCVSRSASMEDLCNIYDYIIKKHSIEAILVADGGYDSLLSGTEEELGTPVEDMMTLSSIHTMIQRYKLPAYVSSLGLHLEHEIRETDMFESITRLSAHGGLLDCIFLQKDQPHVREYMNIVMECQPENTIINSQIVAALEGHYGNYYHPAIRHRVGSIPTNINYLTHTMHIFNLEHIVAQNKYIHLIKNGKSDKEVDEIIKDYRSKITYDFRGKLKSKKSDINNINKKKESKIMIRPYLITKK